MIGVEDLGSERGGGLVQLFRGHRKWLVAGQECNVYRTQIPHLGDDFRIARNIDTESVHDEYKPVVPFFWMKLEIARSGVVGSCCLDGHVICQSQAVTVLHHCPLFDHVCATLVEDQPGAIFGQDIDCGRVEVVTMFVCDEDEVCPLHL